MKKYIVTGFNEEYAKWGSAWIASLQAFGDYQDEVLIYDFGIPDALKNKIESIGAKVLTVEFTGNYRNDIFKSIAKLAKQEDSVFCYWDADTHFQSSIKEIFDVAANKLLCTTHPGFLAGQSYQWLLIQDLIDTFQFLDVKDDLHIILNQYYSEFLTKIDDTWNYSNITKLKNKDGFLYAKDELVKVIHVPNNFKIYASNRNIFFWERHESIYNRIYDSKKINIRKLVRNKLPTID